MANFLKTKTPLIIDIIVFAVYQILFWVIAGPNVKNCNPVVWVGYGFLFIPFIVFGLLTLLKLSSQNAMTSIVPLFLATVIYFIISLIVNLIFMCVNSKDGVTAAIILNIIFILIYAIMMVVAYKIFSRVNDNTKVRETRMRELREVAIKVNALTFLTKEEEIIMAIKALKKNIDNSSSAGNEKTQDSEKEFEEQIDAIKTMIVSGYAKDDILNAINAAEGLLKARNAILLASR